MKVKYKDWILKSKLLKTGWKITAVKKTKYGTQTMEQRAPFSATGILAFKCTKRMIDFYESR